MICSRSRHVRTREAVSRACMRIRRACASGRPETEPSLSENSVVASRVPRCRTITCTSHHPGTPSSPPSAVNRPPSGCSVTVTGSRSSSSLVNRRRMRVPSGGTGSSPVRTIASKRFHPGSAGEIVRSTRNALASPARTSGARAATGMVTAAGGVMVSSATASRITAPSTASAARLRRKARGA